MHHILIAVDCWHNMPDDQVRAIADTQADLHIHHTAGEGTAHNIMPPWDDCERETLIKHVKQHQPCRVTYVGQWWQECLQNKPLGIRWLSQFRPWVNIQVMPSLCRYILQRHDRGDPTDRTMMPTDLQDDWRQVSDDVWQMI